MKYTNLASRYRVDGVDKKLPRYLRVRDFEVEVHKESVVGTSN